MAKPPTAPTVQPDQAKPSEFEALETKIKHQIGDMIDEIPDNTRDELVRRVTSFVVSEHFSGPIAHPAHLGAYEEVHPGSADRIIAMAEAQQQHVISTERKLVEADIADRKLGMIFGAGLFFTLIIIAAICAVHLQSIELTAIFLGATVISGIGLFIKGRHEA